MGVATMVLGVSDGERSRHARRLAAATGTPLVQAAAIQHAAVDGIAEALDAAAGVVVEVPASVQPMHVVGMLADAELPGAIECVVDARTLLRLLGLAGLPPCGCGRAQRLVEQLEQATVATIVGWHPLDTPTLSTLMALVAHVAPRARLRLDRGVVDPPVGRRIHAVHDHPGWTCVLNGDHDPHMTDRRVSAMRFEHVRPLHPARLVQALDALGSGRHGAVVRSAGFVALATRPGRVGWWDQAAGSFALHALDADPDDPVAVGQDLAIIGVDLDRSGIAAALAAAALDDDELAAGPAAWARYADPLPAWEPEPAG
ncbi:MULTISPECIES: GTP-binding protein [unclassified Agrococcus]|uniref:GTP-binding protein n=1 Tax=unclassified Agrococcus TaxID=2615065 RepID=UPI00361AEF34